MTTLTFRKIDEKISSSFLNILVVVVIIWVVLCSAMISHYYAQKNHREKKIIEFTSKLFERDLAGTVINIVNTPEFKRFLNSGTVDQKLLTTDLEDMLVDISWQSILGWDVIYENGGKRYSIGRKSGTYIEIDACYSGRSLDPENGDCVGVVRGYIEEKNLERDISQFNEELKSCGSCPPHILSENNDLYRLVSDYPIRFSVPESDRYIYAFIALSIILIIIAIIFVRSKVKGIFSNQIIDPLKEGVAEDAWGLTTAQIVTGLKSRGVLLAQTRGIDREKERLAGEIHDNIGTSIYTLKIACYQLFDRIKDHGFEGILRQEKLNIQQGIKDLAKTSNDIIDDLKPEVIATVGIVGAIDELLSKWKRAFPNRGYGLELYDDSCSDGEELTGEHKERLKLLIQEKISKEIEHAAYMVVRESLNNVAKHSDCKFCVVMVSVKQIEQEDRFIVSVFDNGQGVKNRWRRGGLGMLSMQNRVESLFGDFSVNFNEKNSTVTAKFPLD